MQQKNDEILNFIENGQCASDVDLDLVVKRLKLGYSLEEALNTPRDKFRPTRSAERKLRQQQRAEQRNRQFIEANSIRADRAKGLTIKELMSKYRRSKTYVSKVINKVLWYNPQRAAE